MSEIDLDDTGAPLKLTLRQSEYFKTDTERFRPQTFKVLLLSYKRNTYPEEYQMQELSDVRLIQ